jgi:hypothetical protein
MLTEIIGDFVFTFFVFLNFALCRRGMAWFEELEEYFFFLKSEAFDVLAD